MKPRPKEFYTSNERQQMLCGIETSESILNGIYLITSVLKRSVPAELALRGSSAGFWHNARCLIRSPIMTTGTNQLWHESCKFRVN
jgi:hypothetical protein